MNPLLHQCFFLLDLTTGKFSNFINGYYGIYKKFVCSDIKRRCRHKAGMTMLWILSPHTRIMDH